jgi:hypothetical protein
VILSKKQVSICVIIKEIKEENMIKKLDMDIYMQFQKLRGAGIHDIAYNEHKIYLWLKRVGSYCEGILTEFNNDRRKIHDYLDNPETSRHSDYFDDLTRDAYDFSLSRKIVSGTEKHSIALFADAVEYLKKLSGGGFDDADMYDFFTSLNNTLEEIIEQSKVDLAETEGEMVAIQEMIVKELAKTTKRFRGNRFYP